MNIVFWSVMAIAFVAGIALFPLGMFVLAPSLSRGLRSTIGRVQWTIGSLSFGDYGLYERASGRPEIVAADYDRNEIRVDDTWVHVVDDLVAEDITIDGTPVVIDDADVETLQLDTRIDLKDTGRVTGIKRRLRRDLSYSLDIDPPDDRHWPRRSIRYDDLIGHEIGIGDQRFTVNDIDWSGHRLHATERWREVADASNWSMLGKQPFVLAYEDDEAAFDEIAADESELAESEDRIAILDRERGGNKLVSKVDPDAGYAVDIMQLVDRWRDAAGIAIAGVAKKQALKDHGGDKGDLSNKQLVIGVLLAMLMGGLFGYVSFFL